MLHRRGATRGTEGERERDRERDRERERKKERKKAFCVFKSSQQQQLGSVWILVLDHREMS
jgi:hypothetical protein